MENLDFLFIHSNLVFLQELLQTGKGLDGARPDAAAVNAFIKLSEYFNVAIYFEGDIPYPNLEKWADNNLAIHQVAYAELYKTGKPHIFGIVSYTQHPEIKTYPFDGRWKDTADLLIAEVNNDVRKV